MNESIAIDPGAQLAADVARGGAALRRENRPAAAALIALLGLAIGLRLAGCRRPVARRAGVGRCGECDADDLPAAGTPGNTAQPGRGAMTGSTPTLQID